MDSNLLQTLYFYVIHDYLYLIISKYNNIIK